MLSLRPVRVPDDLAAYADICTASNAANQMEESLTPQEAEHLLATAPNFDPLADVVLAEWDDVPVGIARLWWGYDDDRLRLYWIEAHVRPDWHRRGVGSRLLSWLEDRAQAAAAAYGVARPVRLRVYLEDTGIGKQALLAAAGYQAIRFFHFMRRPTLDDLPEPAFPPGFALRPAQPSQLRAIWEAKSQAFAGHWGSDPPTEERYLAWSANPSHDLSLWSIVWDEAAGAIAGIAINRISVNDNERFGFKRGWVDTLGVRPAWRGRGLGRALLIHSLHLLRAAGMTEAVLGVDTANASGAPRLYESVGFVTINKDAVAEKALVNE